MILEICKAVREYSGCCRNDALGQPDSGIALEAAADPYDVLELREQGESLRAALAMLTPGEREAIETTFFAGLTHAEAAARLNQPLGTIKTRIRSGLHKLRHTLAAEAGKP